MFLVRAYSWAGLELEALLWVLMKFVLVGAAG